MLFNLPQPSILPLQPVVCQKMLVGVMEPLLTLPALLDQRQDASSSWSQPPLWAHLNLPCWMRFLAGAHESSPEQQPFPLGVAPAVPFPIPAPAALLCPSPQGSSAAPRGCPGSGCRCRRRLPWDTFAAGLAATTALPACRRPILSWTFLACSSNGKRSSCYC